MYNLSIGGQQVTTLRLSGDNIAKIFTGVLTSWNDPAIAADNPGLALAAIRIVPVVRVDLAGSTYQLTQWMAARHAPQWTSYCAAVGRAPCAPTSAYPVLAGSAMIGQAGDTGVAGYVAQFGAAGAIGYVESPTAVAAGMPVAKVLNAAGYYTAPTAGHVGLSLLAARIGLDQVQDLSAVYTGQDPRNYELSWYSYMILPTDSGFSSAKGYTLGQFGTYLLCAGQGQVNALGYAALPVNLTGAAYAQLQKVPGAQLPATVTEFLQGCGHGNPTISFDGTDALSATDPMPQPCDRQGPAQCAPPTGTTTSLTGPDRVPAGTVVTLNATVAPATAAGTVQFLDGDGQRLLDAVRVLNGAAQLTTILASGNHSIIARFGPADLTAFGPSVSAPVAVTVREGEPQAETLTVDTPLSEGVLTMTVDSAPVQLSTATLRANHTFESFGVLGAVTISDGRDQTRPGWSVSGQIGDFTDGTHTFSGGYLGWTPAVMAPNAAGDVVAGAAVAPGADPGLRTGGVLASAPGTGGVGTTVLAADLYLRIPSSTQPGLYSATLTITALTNG